MTLKLWLGAPAVALALLSTTTVRAAPITSSATDSRAAVEETSGIDKAASRCWWRNGQRHCRRYREPGASSNRNRSSDYYEHLADKLPYGSQRWWDQMMRENRAGNPGGGGRD